MTKSTITRERLEWLSQISCRDDIEDIGGDEIRELASMALAAMDSEPVGWTEEQELRDVEKDGCGYLFKANPITPHADPRRVILLYRHAQPAQVVHGEVASAIEELKRTLVDCNRYNYCSDAVARVEVACRAAMLQASPVCTCPSGDGSLRWPCPVHPGSSPVIPDGYVMVPVEPNGDMLAAAQDAYGETDGDIASTLRAAIAAAPQEVKGE